MPDVPLSDLHGAFRREKPGKSRDRLQAAVQRKKGRGVDAIAAQLGRAQGTISNWLRRLHDRGPEGRHDRKSPGRPCRLSREQLEAVVRDVGREPADSGFERGNWTAGLVAAHVRNRFGVRYHRSGALALAHRLGFSVRLPRTVHHKTASEEEEQQYVARTVGAIREAAAAGFEVVCMDAAGFENSPSSNRGLRIRGGRDVVRTNFSKGATKAIGAVGDGACHIRFCDRTDSDNVIALLETLRRCHGRVFVICDNARAHKSRKINVYLDGAGGDVVLWYLPPYTPQQNPIEMLWREIKRAIAGRYFEGGFEQMKWSIVRMLSDGQVRIARLFGYMLDAMRDAGQGAPAPRPRPA